MARDVGSYFEKLTNRASGGRRLDDKDNTSISTDRDDDRDNDRKEGSASSSSRSPSSSSSSRSGGGLADVLKDVIGRGRTAAKKTTERVRSSRKPPTMPKPRTRILPPEGVVAIEYSPRIDGDPDPGEVVWTWVPFEEDPEQGKDRPVVVIGRRGHKMVGVPLTTKHSDREAQIVVGTGDWDPKHRKSYARIWRMLDFDEKTMRREGSILPRAQFDRVIAAVDEYYEIQLPSAGKKGSDTDLDDGN